MNQIFKKRVLIMVVTILLAAGCGSREEAEREETTAKIVRGDQVRPEAPELHFKTESREKLNQPPDREVISKTADRSRGGKSYEYDQQPVPAGLVPGITTVKLESIVEPEDFKSTYPAGAKLSPAGDQLLVSKKGDCDLSLYDPATRSEVSISSVPGSGYGAFWSPKGDRIAYKEVDRRTGQENVVIYDLAGGRSIIMGKEEKQCGTPVFSRDGSVGFTAGEYLYVYDGNLALKTKLNLGDKARQTALSPDGEAAAVITGRGVYAIDLKDGRKNTVVETDTEYLKPGFSPDGQKLLLGTADNRLVVADISSGDTRELGRGEAGQWFSAGHRIIYLRNKSRLIDGVDGSEIVMADIADGTEWPIYESATELIGGLSLTPEEDRISCIYRADGEVRIFALY